MKRYFIPDCERLPRGVFLGDYIKRLTGLKSTDLIELHYRIKYVYGGWILSYEE